MKVGIYLNLYGESGRPRATGQLVEQAATADELGFDWLVLGERHLHPPGYHEIVTSLAWLAAHTSRIGLATAGIILPIHQPILLAEQLANIDVLSGGRLSAGFVLGYRPEEFALAGIERHERVQRFERHLDVIDALWRGDTIAWEGSSPAATVQAFISPVPQQRPRPRIWNGGRVSRALERTARLCDGWTTSFNEGVAELASKIAEYRDHPAAARSLGREVIVCREGFCAPTSQAARASLEGPLAALYADYTAWKRSSVDADRYQQPWDEIASRSVVGSPQRCVEELGRYAELGADGVVLRIQPPSLGHTEAMRCL
jgi:alkanesulfonate monooxygenase SsuD/methylene tetrahydromethanopterin reductase-like flavin-dependent oxidoreductase (luciferase family)